MAGNRINILKTNIDNYSLSETIDKIVYAIDNQMKINHAVVNAGKIVAMQKDEKLRKSVNTCDLINADGQSVVWAAKILGKPLKERVAGIDLMMTLLEVSAKKRYKIFFLGAKEDVLNKVIQVVSKNYSKDIIAGHRNGYFKKDEESSIATTIANSGANILLVAISSPIKEIFLHEQRNVLKDVNFTMGVGGSFDILSGKVKRAPKWMQKIGIEWFYRFVQEPTRMWKRYLIGNSSFIIMLIKEALRSPRN